MKMLRRFLATLAILGGVFFLILWALSYLAVRTVEDGTLVTNLASSALDNPAIENAIISAAQGAVDDSLSDQGVSLDELGLDDSVDSLITGVIGNDSFSDTIAAAVESTHEDLSRQLTDDARQPAPLTISLDLGTAVNDALQGAPGIGDSIPDVALQPYQLEVLDADAFERVRGVYGWVDRVAAWAGWVGLGLIVLGILLAPNKRWFLPKLLFWLGGAAALGWFLVSQVDVERLAGLAPGGAEGEVGSALVDLVPQETIDAVAGRLGLGSIYLLAGAVLMSIAVKMLFRKKSPKRGRHAEEPEPQPV